MELEIQAWSLGGLFALLVVHVPLATTSVALVFNQQLSWHPVLRGSSCIDRPWQ